MRKGIPSDSNRRFSRLNPRTCCVIVQPLLMIRREPQNAAQAMKVIIDEEHIVIPIAGIFRIYALQDTVQGFEPHSSRTNQRWDSVSIAAKSG